MAGTDAVYVPMNRRQLHLYTDLVMVFSSGGDMVIIDPVTSEPVYNENYNTANGPYRCKFGYTENVDDVTGVGRIKRFDLDTADKIDFPLDTPVKNASWVVNVTKRSDGTKPPTFGQLNKIVGDAKIITGTGRRPVNVISFRLVADEQVPDYIAVYLTGIND